MAAVAGLLATATWVWLALDWVQITDSQMAPSLVPGDWVLLGPGSAKLGTVVALDDPAWPGRRVLRRVLATAGTRIGIENGLVVVDGNRLRIREMGRDTESLTLSEDDGYLVRQRLTRDRAEVATKTVQEAQIWLLADNRILAIDSRWWGAVHESRITATVWFRFGDPGEWRKRIASDGRDGPWERPKPSAPAAPG
jgi:signal peptidase I